MIRTFRKEQGGYALMYVMVIIIVVMAVVMVICTTAMQNYKAQQESVSRMADKYAAEGEVEKILLQIGKISVTGTKEIMVHNGTPDPAVDQNKAEAIANLKTALQNEILKLDPDKPEEGETDDTPTKITVDPFADRQFTEVKVTCENEHVTISATIKVSLQSVSVSTAEDGTKTVYTASANPPVAEFTEFEMGGAA